mgnify:CR=1 FL=1
MLASAALDADTGMLATVGAALGGLRKAKSEAKVKQRTQVLSAVISGEATSAIRSIGPPKAQAITTSPRTSATAPSAPFICTSCTLERSTPRVTTVRPPVGAGPGSVSAGPGGPTCSGGLERGEGRCTLTLTEEGETTLTATFVGGDALGIGATSERTEQAWDFLSWTTSDEAQVEVVAKNKGVPTRTDLADNKYSSADPRTVLVNGLVAKGRTPYARNFNVSFNDPQSPWLQTVRGALFGDAGRALADGNTAITKSLQQG